ncbi:polysaccharide biosynthesis tyrosine autokinase [Gordonia amicalis]|uniref:non-specific protein-tyrosine kinase n=1 Tax=Gordonia amicalis TaxID=89053 RepID=A0ABU4DJQ5_9ACTN|nr:polysaccharide biosynthesis tyrosine autokinase [Gordonia amicalis]MDV6309972.1 polysaccharide biosynthesis tyrosine autokinase [Gordonia amicalis]
MDSQSQFSARIGSSANALHSAVLVVVRGWWIIVLSGLLGAVLGLGWCFLQTPKYESTATLYVTSVSEGDGDAQGAYQGSLASQQRVASYAKLATSDVILAQALEKDGLAIDKTEARASITTTTEPGTVLLSIAALTPSPYDSQSLANGVAESLAEYAVGLETPMGGGAPLAKLTVVSPAELEMSSASPRFMRTAALALVAGLILGVAAVFVRNRFDRRVWSESDVESLIGTPVLTSVPQDKSMGGAGSAIFSEGGSIAAESYRKLRTSLGFLGVEGSVRKLLVTSGRAAEGKTTTSSNLALAIAEMGQRVVLVDADLRKPSVAKRWGVNGSVGFTNYLRGDAELSELIQRTEVEHLDVLAAGSLPPNPAELLGTDRASELFDHLASVYDYVIVDSSPVLPVSDTLLAAQWMDGIVVVVRSGRTMIPELTSVQSELDQIPTRVLGVVLNDVARQGDSYQYSYYGDPELIRVDADDNARFQ